LIPTSSLLKLVLVLYMHFLFIKFALFLTGCFIFSFKLFIWIFSSFERLLSLISSLFEKLLLSLSLVKSTLNIIFLFLFFGVFFKTLFLGGFFIFSELLLFCFWLFIIWLLILISSFKVSFILIYYYILSLIGFFDCKKSLDIFFSFFLLLLISLNSVFLTVVFWGSWSS